MAPSLLIAAPLEGADPKTWTPGQWTESTRLSWRIGDVSMATEEAEHWAQCITTVEEGLKLGTVIASLFLVDKVEDAIPFGLVTQIQNAFKPGAFYSRLTVPRGIQMAWRRDDGTPLLQDGSDGGTREVGPNFADFGPANAFWPPPVTSDHLASTGWIFQKTGALLDSDVETIRATMKVPMLWIFRLLTKEGLPTDHYMVRPVTYAQQDQPLVVGGVPFTPIRRCGYCKRGQPFVVDHDIDQCPLIGRINKARDRLGYTRIRVEHGVAIDDGAKIVVDPLKKLEALEVRVAALERGSAGAGKPAKASAKPGGSGKRVTKAPAGAPPPKKAKTDGAKAKAQVKPGKKDGGGKGKDAKGKKKAT